MRIYLFFFNNIIKYKKCKTKFVLENFSVPETSSARFIHASFNPLPSLPDSCSFLRPAFDEPLYALFLSSFHAPQSAAKSIIDIRECRIASESASRVSSLDRRVVLRDGGREIVQ